MPKQTTLAIDPTTDDIQIPFTWINGRDALKQRIQHKFQFFIREHFLDLRQGAPYYEYVFVKNPDERLIRIILRQIIEQTPEVDRIVHERFTYDKAARTLTFDELEIRTTDDQVFRFQPDEFIIRLPIPVSE